MERRRVRTIDDIVFDKKDHAVTLYKGNEYEVEKVLERVIILCTDDGDRIMIDLETFENGFEAIR